jgi:hypothetical protein
MQEAEFQDLTMTTTLYIERIPFFKKGSLLCFWHLNYVSQGPTLSGTLTIDEHMTAS